MSGGAEHYAAAEELLARVNTMRDDATGKVGDSVGIKMFEADLARLVAEAQVHATLAHAAVLASALRDDLPGTQIDQWVIAGVL